MIKKQVAYFVKSIMNEYVPVWKISYPVGWV